MATFHPHPQQAPSPPSSPIHHHSNNNNNNNNTQFSRKPLPDAPTSLPTYTTHNQQASMTSTSCPSCGHNIPGPGPGPGPGLGSGSGTQEAKEAQLMIQDLQAQVRLLNSKAAAAVDRLADYEDEIRVLRAERGQGQRGEGGMGGGQQQHQQQWGQRGNMAAGQQQQQGQAQIQQAPQSRLSTLRSYLGGGRRNPSADSTNTVDMTGGGGGGGASGGAWASHPNLPSTNPTSGAWQGQGQPQQLPASSQSFPSFTNPPSGGPSSSMPPPPAPLPQPAPSSTPLPPPTGAPASGSEPTLLSLQSSLHHETHLRHLAESSLTQTQLELEELTAILFGQANEMVAEERRARSRLEERVRVLERREREKGERLKVLEGRVGRVERVRGLVG